MKQDYSIKGSILPTAWIEWKWPSLLEKRVADLGCGKGAMTEWFADQGAFVDAFDIQDVFGSSKNINFKVRDVFSPQFQFEKSYDIVLASFLFSRC